MPMADPMKIDDVALPKLATLNLIGAVYIDVAMENVAVTPHNKAHTKG